MSEKEENEKISKDAKHILDALKLLRNLTGYGTVTLTVRDNQIVEIETAFTVRPEKEL